jgi:lysophospholipase L1-like esterase
MRKIIFDLVIVFMSVLMSAVGLEVLTRVVVDDGMQFDLEMWKYARDVKQIAADPLLGHEHAPNRQAHLMGVDFRTNSMGLRDREFPYDRVPGKFRVLMLGDSITVGWGTELKDTFAKRIERLYAATGVDAEVINTGVGNYNTMQEVEYFITKGYRFRPDMVVLSFFVNDAEPLVPTGSPSALMRVCYACAFAVGQSDAIMRRFLGKADWSEYYLALYDGGKSKGWHDAEEAIGRLADFCKRNGVSLLIASVPELHDVGNYRLQSITDLVRHAAVKFGVGFVDLLPELKDHPSSTLWVTPPDPHPNALAHQLIAHGLFNAMKDHRASD